MKAFWISPVEFIIWQTNNISNYNIFKVIFESHIKYDNLTKITTVSHNIYLNYNTTDNIKAIKFKTIKTALRMIKDVLYP